MLGGVVAAGAAPSTDASKAALVTEQETTATATATPTETNPSQTTCSTVDESQTYNSETFICTEGTDGQLVWLAEAESRKVVEAREAKAKAAAAKIAADKAAAQKAAAKAAADKLAAEKAAAKAAADRLAAEKLAAQEAAALKAAEKAAADQAAAAQAAADRAAQEAAAQQAAVPGGTRGTGTGLCVLRELHCRQGSRSGARIRRLPRIRSPPRPGRRRDRLRIDALFSTGRNTPMGSPSTCKPTWNG
jgi:hypothetical protein